MQLINMIMIYYWGKKLKKKKRKKKDLHVQKADIITIKKNIDLMSLAQRNVFQMTTIELVSF